jgi:hypothetical protein
MIDAVLALATPLVGLIGAKALWLTYLWLGSAILASWISNRKGYGEKPGLAAGLLLSAVGVIVWLCVPGKDDARWPGWIPSRPADDQ